MSEKGGHAPGIETVKANGLAEGFGTLIAFIPSISNAIILKFATPDSMQRTTNWRHAWKGGDSH